MNASDRRVFEMTNLLADWCALGRIREKAIHRIERERNHKVVEGRFAGSWIVFTTPYFQPYLCIIDRERFDQATEMQFSSTLAHVFSGSVIEFGKWDGRNSHLSRGGRLHRFTNHLRRGRDGNSIQFLA